MLRNLREKSRGKRRLKFMKDKKKMEQGPIGDDMKQNQEHA